MCLHGAIPEKIWTLQSQLVWLLKLCFVSFLANTPVNLKRQNEWDFVLLDGMEWNEQERNIESILYVLYTL